MSAQVLGAAEVYVVDHVEERLEKARALGAIAVDATKAGAVEQIREMRAANPLVQGALRPGEEKMPGVMCGIDAVGYQARAHGDPAREAQTQAIEDLVELVNPTGAIGLIGVYLPQDPGAPDEAAKQGAFKLPLGKAWSKGITVGTGQAPVKRYNVALRDLIIAGRIKPSIVVSHHIGFEAAPDAYAHFDKREQGYTKVIIRPALVA